MTDIREAAEAVPSEIEVSPLVVWEALIVDGDGFVVSDHEDIDEIIREFPDENVIDHRWGDVFPDEIVIVTGSASPSPAGSSRRLPGSHYTDDKVFEQNLELLETDAELQTLWERAKAMAEGLNAHEQRRFEARSA